jgi:type IV pilus assembly protein PilN
MPKINLLPWREELRQKRKKDFLAALLGAAIFGGALTFATKWVVQQQIDNQQARNTILQQEIAQLDQQIEEIRGLENQKERLLARMRPLVVHLFDELVETMPEGMHLSNVEQVNDRVDLQGIATSTTRVATLMRNIEGSQWLAGPQLGSIQAESGTTGRTSRFAVAARQVADKPKNEEGSE